MRLPCSCLRPAPAARLPRPPRRPAPHCPRPGAGQAGQGQCRPRPAGRGVCMAPLHTPPTGGSHLSVAAAPAAPWQLGKRERAHRRPRGSCTAPHPGVQVRHQRPQGPLRTCRCSSTSAAAAGSLTSLASLTAAGMQSPPACRGGGVQGAMRGMCGGRAAAGMRMTLTHPCTRIRPASGAQRQPELAGNDCPAHLDVQPYRALSVPSKRAQLASCRCLPRRLVVPCRQERRLGAAGAPGPCR